jgi:hypothetical protein
MTIWRACSYPPSSAARWAGQRWRRFSTTRRSHPNYWSKRPPVRGLRPIVGTQHDIDDRGPGRGGDKDVVGRHERERSCGHCETPLRRSDHRRNDHCPNPRKRQDISEDIACFPPPRRNPCPRRKYAPQRVDGEGGPEQRADDRSCDQDRSDRCPKRAEIADQGARRARMDDKRLDPAFLYTVHRRSQTFAECQVLLYITMC